MLRIPNRRKEYVKSFCRKVSLGQQPEYVKHDPMYGAPLKECFSIVPQKISERGGCQKFGWAIFEIRKIWLEAEFHVVWENNDGTLIDLTPREVSVERILFLPDPTRTYEGKQVNSIFQPISKKPSVHKFIALSKDYYRAVNEGDLADVQSGYIECPEAIEIRKEMDGLFPQIIQEHY